MRRVHWDAGSVESGPPVVAGSVTAGSVTTGSFTPGSVTAGSVTAGSVVVAPVGSEDELSLSLPQPAMVNASSAVIVSPTSLDISEPYLSALVGHPAVTGRPLRCVRMSDMAIVFTILPRLHSCSRSPRPPT